MLPTRLFIWSLIGVTGSFVVGASNTLSHYPTLTSNTVASAATSSSTSQGMSGSRSSNTTGDLNQPLDISIDGKLLPPAIALPVLSNVETPKDVSISCVNCSINGVISVSGGVRGHNEGTTSAFETAGKAVDFDFDELWVGAIMDNMTAHIDLAVNVTTSNDTNEFAVPLYTNSKSRIIDGVVIITTVFTPEIHGWINTTMDVNFTHGFDFTMQPGTGFLIPLEHLDRTQSFGFNQTMLTPLPYTATSGNVDMQLELILRPKFDFLVSVLEVVTVEASAYLDVPKLDVQVSSVQNVTSSCDPPSSMTPTSQRFKNLTNVVPSIGFGASVTFSANEVVDEQQSPPFLASWMAQNFSTACLAFDQTAKTMEPAVKAKPAEVASNFGVGFERSFIALGSAVNVVIAIVA